MQNRPQPRITTAIIGITIGVFLVQFFVLGLPMPEVLSDPGKAFTQRFYGILMLNAGFFEGFFWQPVTHMFLHANILHLLMNMVGLFIFGPHTEERIGKTRTVLVYFLGGILGGLAQIILAPAHGLLGASGGVFAVALAFLACQPDRRLDILIFFIQPARIKARTLAFAFLGSSAFLAVTGIFAGIGHVAHLVGGLTGWLFVRQLMVRKARHFYEHHRGRALGGYQPQAKGKIIEITPMHDTRSEGEARMVNGHASNGTQTAVARQPRSEGNGRTAGKRDAELEAVLNKVLAHGLQSLTPDERAILERNASRTL